MGSPVVYDGEEVTVRGVVPATDFALGDSLENLPDLEFEIERIVDTGDDAVMPLLWVRGSDIEEAEKVFEADPTVDEVTLLAEFEQESLYRMTWVSRVKLLLQMLTSTEATILDAYGHDNRWDLRVMYPDRKLVSATMAFCEDHGISFDIESIREMEGEPAGRFGLTIEQFEALRAATQNGYFSIPRETSLEELADEFGISHQALSERIRRGTEALVEDTLFIGFPDET